MPLLTDHFDKLLLCAVIELTLNATCFIEIIDCLVKTLVNGHVVVMFGVNNRFLIVEQSFVIRLLAWWRLGEAAVLHSCVVVWLLPGSILGGASLDFLDGVERSGVHKVTRNGFVHFGVI